MVPLRGGSLKEDRNSKRQMNQGQMKIVKILRQAFLVVHSGSESRKLAPEFYLCTFFLMILSEDKLVVELFNSSAGLHPKIRTRSKIEMYSLSIWNQLVWRSKFYCLDCGRSNE